MPKTPNMQLEMAFRKGYNDSKVGGKHSIWHTKEHEVYLRLRQKSFGSGGI